MVRWRLPYAECASPRLRPRRTTCVRSARSDSEAGALDCDRNGAFRIQQADGVVFRRCSLQWDAEANPELNKAFTLHDASSPDVDAASSMNDR